MRKRVFIIFSLFMILMPAEAERDLVFSREFPKALRREILADFTFLDSIQGRQSSPLHQEIFGAGPLDGRRYTQFLRQYIQSLEFVDQPSPYQVMTNGKKHLYVYANYLHFARHVSKFSRSINFIHEAYHNSGSHHHVKCPSPFLDEFGREIKTTVGRIPLGGLHACDDQYNGSYAIEIIMAKNIEKYCDNCSHSLRREAGAYADDLMKRIVGNKARTALLRDLYDDQPIKVSGPVEHSLEAIQKPKQGYL